MHRVAMMQDRLCHHQQRFWRGKQRRESGLKAQRSVAGMKLHSTAAFSFWKD